MTIHANPQASVLDAKFLRRVLGHFTTGVVIIAADTPSLGLIGFTVNSFNTVSLDPPLVLFSVARAAYSLGPLLRSSFFSINILGREQQALSDSFARAGADKWADVSYHRTQNGTPVFTGVVASLECSHYACYDGGDHNIVVGHVLAAESAEEADPLLFFRARYHAVGQPLAGARG